MSSKSKFLVCMPLLFTLGLAGCVGTSEGSDAAGAAPAASDDHSALLVGRWLGRFGAGEDTTMWELGSDHGAKVTELGNGDDSELVGKWSASGTAEMPTLANPWLLRVTVNGPLPSALYEVVEIGSDGMTLHRETEHGDVFIDMTRFP